MSAAAEKPIRHPVIEGFARTLSNPLTYLGALAVGMTGRAFANPADEVARLREIGLENAIVILAPNLIGAGDVIRDPAFRLDHEQVKQGLIRFFQGERLGKPVCSMADLLN